MNRGDNPTRVDLASADALDAARSDFHAMCKALNISATKMLITMASAPYVTSADNVLWSAIYLGYDHVESPNIELMLITAYRETYS